LHNGKKVKTYTTVDRKISAFIFLKYKILAAYDDKQSHTV